MLRLDGGRWATVVTSAKRRRRQKELYKGEALEPWRAHALIQLQRKTNGEMSLGFGMDRFKDITVVNTYLLTQSPELAVKSSSILLIKRLNILWVVIT